MAEMVPTSLKKSSLRRTSSVAASLIDFGTIKFTMHNTTQHAEHMIVSVDTPKSIIIKHMMQEWQLNKSGVMLRATHPL